MKSTPFRAFFSSAVILVAASPFALALTPDNSPEPDRKIEVIRTTEPVLRPSIGVKLPPGQATVLIQVDAAGQLMDTLVVSYTHPYYAESVAKALKLWRYKPATLAGQPVVSRAQLRFHFDVRQQVLTFTRSDLAEVIWDNAAGTPKDVQCVFAGKDLHEAPRPLSTVQPLRIAPPDQSAPAGRVLIDFFIDEQGVPRLPAVVRFDDERMAGSALQAISQWRFSPPTRDGRPVAVRAQQWFDFAADK